MSKSIIQNDHSECFICGNTRNLEEHHIFQGSNRKNSEHFGLKVKICYLCHRGNEGAHNNMYLKRELHLIGQTAFVEKYGYTKFLDVFGMNYIEAGLQEGYLYIEDGYIRGKYGLKKVRNGL